MTRVENAEWFKSSHSNGNGECVEVAYLDDAVAMRDSKDPSGPALLLSRAQMSAFVGAVVAGRIGGIA
ncbi:DUF397 domain-containing protein [Streptomyces laurentii]|uniref:DUF397 domain-containing protein n=1 Tax=Streptomyces laurentii TaxID=39478 RepID=UPI00369C140D